jgi:2-aminoadipate transaminase
MRRGAPRRAGATAAELDLPLIEDNPYGDLWFDTTATGAADIHATPMAAFTWARSPRCWHRACAWAFMVAPKAVYPKLLQAKQAADLHSPGFNQRMIAEVMKDGFLDRHVPTIRALYKAQRDAMLAALTAQADTRLTWNTPAGGMFLWARLPAGMNAQDLLPFAVDQGVAFVPGAPFYADHGDARTLRLSFVTPSVEEIHRGVAMLAAALNTYASTLSD